MRNLIVALFCLVLLSPLDLAAQAPSQSDQGGPAKGPKKLVTIKGEILDLGCYLSRGLRGPLHKECALKCVLSGVPMGLITADSTVYLLTQNHDRAMTPAAFTPPDPFQDCKRWAAQTVEVRGWIWERDGINSFEVKGAKLVPATPASP